LEKSTDAFRTIGEMAAELGVKTHILRYWEEHFLMLRPLKRAGGRRHYRADDVAMLHAIHNLLYKEGYTIKGAAKFLSGGAIPAHPPMYAAQATPQSATQASPQLDLTALRAVRDRLSAALAAA
jgi:DNA-binding transcriptional MerR regulator